MLFPFGSTRIYRPGFFARLFRAGRWKLTLDERRRDVVRVSQGRDVDLPCLDVIAVATRPTLLSHCVELVTRSRTVGLPALSASAASDLARDLRAFIKAHLFALVTSDRDSVREVDATLQRFTANNRQYLAQADLARAIAHIPGSISAALSHPLFDATAMPADLARSLPKSIRMMIDPGVRHAYNEDFVRSELHKFRCLFDDVDGRSLSDEQREACIRLEDNNLLLACAGSGKTATIVGKVAYVVEKQLYRPDDILIVALNRNAVAELRARIARQLRVDEKALTCTVSTFHALGRGIIEAVEGQPPQLANWVDSPAAEARLFDEIVDELLANDSDFQRLWTDLLIVHPTADRDVDRIDSDAERQRYDTDRLAKGQATIRTSSGTVVKSLQERKIAEWLWLHSIAFDYERRLTVTDGEGTVRHFSPDFHYPESNTIHEHFAIDTKGEAPYPDYVRQAKDKRRAYRDNGLDFFETTSAQAEHGELIATLQAELERRGVPMRRKTYAEISAALEPVVIKRYHRLVATCIKHMRAGQLTLDMLVERAKSLHDRERSSLFARAVSKIAEAYAAKLDWAGRIDFETMIGRAAELITEHRFENPYRLILVDEFQDISEPRARLIKALRRQKPFTKVFAVGDDWQAIYRFAGSDVTICTDFEAHFGTSWQGRLQRTYRCNQLIAATAATFIQRNPGQIKKSVSSTLPAISRSIRVVPISRQGGGPNFEAACRRLLARLDHALGEIASQWRQQPSDKLQVIVLWRYNHTNPFGARSPRFANIDVKPLSFHRAKGLEADYVVMLDISEGDYGVPSDIEDDELLELVLPRSEQFTYAEERRLFYVALTRARRGVYMLTNSRAPSHFVHELRGIAGSEMRFETIDGQELIPCPACVEGQLVERRRRDDGKAFWGCSRYPSCDYTTDSLADATTANASPTRASR